MYVVYSTEQWSTVCYDADEYYSHPDDEYQYDTQQYSPNNEEAYGGYEWVLPVVQVSSTLPLFIAHLWVQG